MQVEIPTSVTITKLDVEPGDHLFVEIDCGDLSNEKAMNYMKGIANSIKSRFPPSCKFTFAALGTTKITVIKKNEEVKFVPIDP